MFLNDGSKLWAKRIAQLRSHIGPSHLAKHSPVINENRACLLVATVLKQNDWILQEVGIRVRENDFFKG